MSHRFLLPALAFLVAVAVWAPQGARALEAYEVTVPVDVTGESAAQAREQALAEGQAASMRKLLERLTLAEDHWRLPVVEAQDLPLFVSDFSVADEKTSDVRYLADLTVRYKPSEMRDLLRAYDLPFAETASKPVLVLALLGGGIEPVLWEEPNPWRSAWARFPGGDGLVPLVQPLGDLEDMTGVRARQARDGGTDALARVAARYGAEDALVTTLVLDTDPTGSRFQAEVTVARHGTATWMSKSFTELAESVEGEAQEAFLDRLVATVAARVEDEWKRDNLLRFDTEGILAATVPVSALADWLGVRRRLGHVAVVSQVEVILLARDEVRINLHHIGDVDQLALALAQEDLTLTLEGDQWVLVPAAR